MSASVIDGRTIAAEIDAETASLLASGARAGRSACLAALTVGSNPAAESYSKQKQKSASKLGIDYMDVRLPAETTLSSARSRIRELAEDRHIDGLIVHTPIPAHLNADLLLDGIPAAKDVDCAANYSRGMLYSGRQLYAPATAEAVIEIMLRSGFTPGGKHVVVLGRSLVVGRPLATLLLGKGKRGDATVTVCHSKTKNIGDHTRRADILVSAIGSAGYVKREMVSRGAVVIDVGINAVPSETGRGGYRLVGDVDFTEVSEVAGAITPVPGGVGPVTASVLMRNVASSFLGALETSDQ